MANVLERFYFYFLKLPHEVKEVDRRGKMDDWEKATTSSRDFPFIKRFSGGTAPLRRGRIFILLHHSLGKVSVLRLHFVGFKMHTNVNIWSAMIWMMSFACFIYLFFLFIYMIKSMEWDHNRLWWELCYLLWGNWSGHEMLWVATRGYKVKMNDFVMLTRIKIGKGSGELWRCGEWEHWCITGMETMSDFERWRMLMTIHDDVGWDYEGGAMGRFDRVDE